jgi:dTDP-4-amino-4,6-dideoxygalactose transaminase
MADTTADNGADSPIKDWLSGHGDTIPLFKVFMPESVMEPLREVLFSGYIGEGPRVAAFENELAPWFGSPNVLALNTGTAAIQLALRLAGVGPGDQVISTPVTCVATNEPVLACGAEVTWADIDPGTGNIDPVDIARKITPRTKAVLAVHWGGYPCDMDEINELARRHGLKVIEDACHAFGAVYHGAPVGSHSDFVCFSFQAIKEITTVDGGALVCRSEDDCERGRLLRWYGIDRRPERKDFRCEEDIRESGYKLHMNDVAAVIGLEQLKYVADNLARTRAHAARYNDGFRDLEAVRPLSYRDDRLSSYWLYTLHAADRASFTDAMAKEGITVSQVHARNDTHTIFRPYKTDLPGVDAFTAGHVCIPVGWWLDDDQVEHIIAAVRRYGRAAGPSLRE